MITGLQKLLMRPDFIKMNGKAVNDAQLKDVYDGKIWKEFHMYDGKPFLLSENTFGLMLNIDWFQPYKYSQYSIGAVYLVIMNLPRKHRFLRENILLCGILPGPKEPRLHINQFLKPLVDDLLTLLSGIELNVFNKG